MNFTHPDTIRGLIFISLLIVLVAAEWLIPKRQLQIQQRSRTMFVNLMMVVLGSLMIKLLIPLTLIMVSEFNQHFGLLHLLSLPLWLQIIISLILLDSIVYWQHRFFHRIPIFWRIHRMHHSDIAMDTTTAVRFHPVELLLSYLLKIVCVLLLGIDPPSIIIFEIILNGTALWSHSNIAVLPSLDRVMRLILVTPDMHRIHHSVHQQEHNSNYGFCLSIWDRCFGSYTEKPRDGQADMLIGLTEFRQRNNQNFLALLMQPIIRPKNKFSGLR